MNSHTGKWLLVALSVSAFQVHAVDLQDVYTQARAHDAEFARATAARLRIGETPTQTRAALLPTMTLSSNYRHAKFPHGAWKPGLRGALHQQIVDFGAAANHKVAKAEVEVQNALYEAERQALLVRVTQAYVKALISDDNLAFAQADRQVMARRLASARWRHAVGLSGSVDLKDVQARADNTVAQVIVTETERADAYAALTQLTGQATGSLAKLRDDIPLDVPAPEDLAAWVDTSLRRNPNLLAAGHRVVAAERRIEASRAGGKPTLGFDFSYERKGIQPLCRVKPARFCQGFKVGFTLKIPVSSSYSLQPSIRRAIFERDVSAAALESTRRDVARTTARLFRNFVAGEQVVYAARSALASSTSAYAATEAGVTVGTRSVVDLLLARQQLILAQRRHSSTRHQFVLDRLLVRQSAGSLDHSDLVAINALLEVAGPRPAPG